jgi:hypothetical protein
VVKVKKSVQLIKKNEIKKQIAKECVINFKKDNDELDIQYPINDFKMVFGYKAGGRKKQKKTIKNRKNKSKNTKRKFGKK